MFKKKLSFKVLFYIFLLVFTFSFIFLFGFLAKIIINYNDNSSTIDGEFSCGNNFIDIRDNQQYSTIKIGSQCWLKENMNYETENSWCYKNKKSMCKVYGRLYNWYDAMKVCPLGWKLPTYDDWVVLETSIIGDTPCKNLDERWKCSPVGERMKTSEWGGNNQSGFTALPAGFLHYFDGNFYGEGSISCFWSSSERETRAWNRTLHRDVGYIAYRCDPKLGGGSVRCLKSL